MNLGSIYQDLGNINQALTYTLKSLELKFDNPRAINNIKGIINQLNIDESNKHEAIKAYELLLNKKDLSHAKLSRIFLYIFLPKIQKAAKLDPIICESNDAFKELSTDWRFCKSLTLIIPPNTETERFFTRLRKELLMMAIDKGTIPAHLKPFTESLAVQCFLNEYIYLSSQEEERHVEQIIKNALSNQDIINRYLPIVGCYKDIYNTCINQKLINNYPTPDEISKELITSQFTNPCHESTIKGSFKDPLNITDLISLKVQKMYEENPYPRFKYSDHTARELAKTILECIKIETTKKHLTFPESLGCPSASPKVLVAGCGTGSQVIGASRYKNAQITAVDLSGSSLAYAIRKTKEYEMDNVTFRKMDLLNISDIGDIFDIIECGGVLHHMKKPADGLSS